jgi:hypothetical protein
LSIQSSDGRHPRVHRPNEQSSAVTGTSDSSSGFFRFRSRPGDQQSRSGFMVCLSPSRQTLAMPKIKCRPLNVRCCPLLTELLTGGCVRQASLRYLVFSYIVMYQERVTRTITKWIRIGTGIIRLELLPHRSQSLETTWHWQLLDSACELIQCSVLLSRSAFC